MILKFKFKFKDDESAENCAMELMGSQVMSLGVYVDKNDVLLIIPAQNNLPGSAAVFAEEIFKTSLRKYIIKPTLEDRAIAEEYSKKAITHLKFSENLVNQKPELN
jgi:hypothetical protein